MLLKMVTPPGSRVMHLTHRHDAPGVAGFADVGADDLEVEGVDVGA